jgi:hypothetical protein
MQIPASVLSGVDLHSRRRAKSLVPAVSCAWLVFLAAPTTPLSAQQIYTAASCGRADVQAAINAHLANPQDGDIIAIPAGSCTWTGTTEVTATFTRNVTIQGAGAISATDRGASTTGSDVTTITDNLSSPGHSIMDFTVTSGKTLRITGFRVLQNGSSTTTQNGVISISGGANCIRIDHMHFVINADSSMTIAVWGGVTGVIDHNYFDSAVGNGPFAVYLQNGVGTGDAAWSAPDDFGTDKFIFIEDNRWRNGYLGDANTGGQRFVYRYNTAVMEAGDSVPTLGYVANHGLTAGRGRSTRAFEYYQNNLSAPAPGLNKSPFPVNGGTGLVWGNTVTQYRFVTYLDYTRKSNDTYGYGTPPSGWGNCTGTSGTVWDNTGGYPCIDAPGRGRGDLLSGGSISSTINTRTGTQAWPAQSLSPIYVWGNSLTPASYSPVSIVDIGASSQLIRANRDFYQQFGTYGESGTFDGTRGVGQGLFSTRPATCTAGPGGNTPGVGYWATDRNTLYVCTATNTWTTYYTPFTYPHPLQSGGASAPVPPPPSTDTTPPSTPSSLTANAVSSTSVNLSWTASTDNVGVTGYRVERCQGAACSDFTQIATPTSNSFSDTSLLASTAYRYRVRAADAAGNLSAFSSIASATTQAGGGGAPPPLPTGNAGIASQFPNDANIQNHASVLFADGFETYTSTSQLTSSGNFSNFYNNNAIDTSVFFNGSKSLRVRMPQTTTGYGSGIEKFIPEQDTLFMRVYERFQPDYAGIVDAHNGIEISGNYPGPGIRPNGSDFFLVLVENSRYLDEGEPGYTNAYVYHPEQDDLYGEHWYPDGFVSNGTQSFGPFFVPRPRVIPARGQWICYEVMVKLNTPGQRDGRVAVWQDGNLIADWQNLRFRDTTSVRISKITMGNGGKSSSQQNDKWYDNLVLATSYIGPMSTGSQPMPPTGLGAAVQ